MKKNTTIYYFSELNLPSKSAYSIHVMKMCDGFSELGYKVKYFEVDHYICWGTPNDLQTYQYWQRFFNKVEWHPYNYDQDYFSS